jgi:hypothetical protein
VERWDSCSFGWSCEHKGRRSVEEVRGRGERMSETLRVTIYILSLC